MDADTPLRFGIPYGTPLPDGRTREEVVLGYPGSCDVCGASDGLRHVRVTYDAPAGERTHHECFACFKRVKSRERPSPHRFDP